MNTCLDDVRTAVVGNFYKTPAVQDEAGHYYVEVLDIVENHRKNPTLIVNWYLANTLLEQGTEYNSPLSDLEKFSDEELTELKIKFKKSRDS